PFSFHRYRAHPDLPSFPNTTLFRSKALARGRHARAIHDVAFSEVRRQLTYKSEWYGKILIEVDRWYPSSKTCSECRYTLDELRLDRKSTRLNSSHLVISYAVFCLKK